MCHFRTTDRRANHSRNAWLRWFPRVGLMVCGCVFLAISARAAEPQSGVVLYDFETPGDVASWKHLTLAGAKTVEPAVAVERSSEHATSGKHSLKLTFSGGKWPTAATAQVHDAWLKFTTFHADVFVDRSCLIAFTVMQEKSLRGPDWDPAVSRWTKTAFLKPGANHVVGAVPQPNDYAVHAKWGAVVGFEISLFQPHEGESIFVDRIRLANDKLPPPGELDFALAGTHEKISASGAAQAVIALGKQRKEKWKRPMVRTVAEIEAEMRATLDEVRKQHPTAVLAILRDGEKGFNPAKPNDVYAGWTDAYFNSHGPDTMLEPRSENRGESATHEVFMRHRSPLMRVDLSSIPNGSEIVAARLVIVRAGPLVDDRTPDKPTMWVVEPCHRPWVETEVNAYAFAKDKFWKSVGGMAWQGEDPDFSPVFLAHGPSQGAVNSWDFTHAARYWTDGKHANHGFMLHGDSHDYITAHTREAARLPDRPAVLVVYVPK